MLQRITVEVPSRAVRSLMGSAQSAAVAAVAQGAECLAHSFERQTQVRAASSMLQRATASAQTQPSSALSSMGRVRRGRTSLEVVKTVATSIDSNAFNPVAWVRSPSLWGVMPY